MTGSAIANCYPVIDAHGHLVPPSLLSRIGAARRFLPDIEVVRHGDRLSALSMPGLDVIRPVIEGLTDPSFAEQWMNEHGIDGQVVATWADWFGYELDAAQGAYWTRLVNDLQMEELRSERFLPLAILPLQDTPAAIAEANRAHALGYRAVTIGCSAAGDELDNVRLEPVWEALAGLGLGVVMHPSYHAADERTSGLGLPNTVGRPHDTDIAVARLLFSGVLKRNPGTKLLLMHGGGSVPLLWGRLQRNAAIAGVEDPDAGRQSLWLDTVVYRPDALRFLVNEFGSDRVLLGSDHPFPIRDPEPLAIVRNANLGQSVERQILSTNAQEFFQWHDVRAREPQLSATHKEIS
jgi:aminocarboxymuconate-semialdehyde decarboxylase